MMPCLRLVRAHARPPVARPSVRTVLVACTLRFVGMHLWSGLVPPLPVLIQLVIVA